MPSTERIDGLIAQVEAGEFVEAIEAYYADDATMQENGAAPRVGRAELVANERRVLAAFEKTHARCLQPVLVSGDHVMIHWLFEFSTADGRTVRLDEVALQRWRGDRIAEERFFYDPVQLQPR
jgi:ketosteroid isomerase-like protein